MRSAIITALGLGACVSPMRVLKPPQGCDWGALPVTVALEGEAERYRGALSDAADEWGHSLVKVVGDDADVTVVVGDVRGDLAATRCEGGRARTVVTIDQGADVLAAVAFIAHGIGHALGVDHSTNQVSVMQATIDPGLMGGEASGEADWKWYAVTESDRAAARRVKRRE